MEINQAAQCKFVKHATELLLVANIICKRVYCVMCQPLTKPVMSVMGTAAQQQPTSTTKI